MTSSQPNGPTPSTMNEPRSISISTDPDDSGSKFQQASRTAPARVPQLATAMVFLLTRSLAGAGGRAGSRAGGRSAVRAPKSA
jgi:hypothetical protein